MSYEGGLQGPTGPTGAAPPVYQGSYYKSANQNLINGSTNVTFDLTGSWNNSGGYITHTNGSTSFTVVTAGLYQLEFNYALNANGATWSGSQTKSAIINVLRGTTEGIIQNSSAIQTSISYAQLSNATFYLEAGDVLSCQVFCNFSSATPFLLGLANVFDLNTWFTWRFIS